MAEEKSLTRDQQEEIRQALDAGNRAAALALVRKHTGFDQDMAQSYLREIEELRAMGDEPDSSESKEGSLSPEDWKSIDSFLFTGHKLTAIKLARANGGYDLKDAKDLVDKREAELKASSPGKFVKPKSGCAGKAAGFFIAVGAGVGALWQLLA